MERLEAVLKELEKLKIIRTKRASLDAQKKELLEDDANLEAQIDKASYELKNLESTMFSVQEKILEDILRKCKGLVEVVDVQGRDPNELKYKRENFKLGGIKLGRRFVKWYNEELGKCKKDLQFFDDLPLLSDEQLQLKAKEYVAKKTSELSKEIVSLEKSTKQLREEIAELENEHDNLLPLMFIRRNKIANEVYKKRDELEKANKRLQEAKKELDKYVMEDVVSQTYEGYKYAIEKIKLAKSLEQNQDRAKSLVEQINSLKQRKIEAERKIYKLTYEESDLDASEQELFVKLRASAENLDILRKIVFSHDYDTEIKEIAIDVVTTISKHINNR